MAEALCHVTTAAALACVASTPGSPAPGRLVGAPFLHCCTEAQLPFVLARHFAGRTGLLVLRFDPAAIEGELRWERSEPDQDPFPHLYGALPVAAARAEPAPGA